MADTTSAPQQQYPDLNPYNSSNGGNNSLENAKNTAINSKSNSDYHHLHILPNSSAAAQQTMDSVKNSQTYQSLANGPVAEKARNEASATSNEFSNLANARQQPSTTTATGQNLTHYHSFFYNLLSWENPRATGISYVAIVTFIFLTRYVPLVRLGLKGAYIILGIMAAAELTGKLILGQGIASKMRPQRYYTIPRETLESMMEDLVELVNFFVIEFQRIVFAENVYVTIGAFTTALITYFLVKITPAWGLALLFTTVTYFVPLTYLQNREFIDHHLNNAQEIVSQQTSQIRDLAAQHTNKAMEASTSTLKSMGARAQETMGQAKKAAVEKGLVKEETAAQVPGGSPSVKQEDFPAAPSQEPAGTDANIAADTKVEPLAA